MTPPKVLHADQLPPADVWLMCQSALSEPSTNTSNRPSALVPTAGLLVIPPPRELHPDQGPPAEVCQLCHNALSPPFTNASSRPSAFLATAALPVNHPPRLLQLLVPPEGGVGAAACRMIPCDPPNVTELTQDPSSL